MNNAKTKEQHYIPRFYLKNFADSNKKFNIINISKKKPINNITYMSQFKEKYFYDKDNHIENKLSQLETDWANLINKIISGDYPSDEEKKKLKEFAIFQRNRTYYKSEELLEMSWQSQKTLIEMKLTKQNKKISDELLSKMKDKYKKEYPHKVITRAIDIAEKNLNIIDDLKVAIIKYDTKSKLISSDNPIVHYNNFDNKSVGYINGGLIIFFPISSEILCVIYDSKIYLELNQDNFIHCKNEYEVKFLNYFQILNAYNFIFFKDDNMTSNLVNELKKNKIQRLLNFPKLKTDILGSDDSKIITFSAQYIYLKHTFSFAKLTQRAKMVPQNAIDWFPRNYDEKYFNGNFKSRKEIVPFLSHLKKKNELKNAVIWTNDEIEKFNKFVIDYWNNKL